MFARIVSECNSAHKQVGWENKEIMQPTSEGHIETFTRHQHNYPHDPKFCPKKTSNFESFYFRKWSVTLIFKKSFNFFIRSKRWLCICIEVSLLFKCLLCWEFIFEIILRQKFLLKWTNTAFIYRYLIKEQYHWTKGCSYLRASVSPQVYVNKIIFFKFHYHLHFFEIRNDFLFTVKFQSF